MSLDNTPQRTSAPDSHGASADESGVSTSPAPAAESPADAWTEHVFSAALGAIDILAIHLGDRLGWCRALASDGPLTADDLARLTGTHPRYAREWLEQQATSGLLMATCDGPMLFSLPAGRRRRSRTHAPSRPSHRWHGCSRERRRRCRRYSTPIGPAAE